MKLDFRKIFVISVLIVCIIAINLAIYFSITKETQKEVVEEAKIDTTYLVENFSEIFENNINYQNNNIITSKIDNTKELVYTSYVKQEKKANAYDDLDINIPYLNIKNEVAEQVNQEINSLFYKKAENILLNANKNTIYTVKYKAYVNDNILSIVINANLKEGESSQRQIIKTYNYNLSSNNVLEIKPILEYRKISEQYAQCKINETIKSASEDINKYQELGFSKYLRNINDDKYKLENTLVFFLGEGKSLYILYPYGNLDYTSEVDLLVI